LGFLDFWLPDFLNVWLPDFLNVAFLDCRSVFCHTDLALASSVRQPDEALIADSIETPQ
jgi:hypothetical protein